MALTCKSGDSTSVFAKVPYVGGERSSFMKRREDIFSRPRVASYNIALRVAVLLYCAQGHRLNEESNQFLTGDYEGVGVPTLKDVQRVCETMCGSECQGCRVAFCSNRGFRTLSSEVDWQTFAHVSIPSRVSCTDIGNKSCWAETPPKETPQTDIIECAQKPDGGCTCDISLITIDQEMTGACELKPNASTTEKPSAELQGVTTLDPSISLAMDQSNSSSVAPSKSASPDKSKIDDSATEDEA
eukprot:TRINITY_DN23501_c0_g1_i1.p1 TRINITY_DN23501_c0_g1~~TRINITY_DN23501_c0_g1_i1.p1  ORF type:complete len:243 (-),score=29.65 TRINITY_DN23501_c0_g1_i1:93-821(-)